MNSLRLQGLSSSRWVQEPFRLFFTAGWVISLAGLILWPLYLLGAWNVHPGKIHAFLLIQGFFGAYAIGFLWTSLPRMLEVAAPGPIWILTALGLVLANTAAHAAGGHLLGHLLFVLLLICLPTFAISRWKTRQDLPPPSFVLVGLGVAAGASGTGLLAIAETGFPGHFVHALGRLLAMEVFLSCLVMGVAAFLAPRFFESSSRQNLPESLKPSGEWLREAAFAGAAGAGVLLGAFIQAAGATRTGSLITGVALTGYILQQVPLLSVPAARQWLREGLRVALLCALCAPWLRVLLPNSPLASAHLLLMGFGLLTLVIGARVTLGHSGYEHLFHQPLPMVGAVTALYILALLARLAAEFLPQAWNGLLLVSGAAVLGAHLLWGVLALPKLLVSPREES